MQLSDAGGQGSRVDLQGRTFRPWSRMPAMKQAGGSGDAVDVPPQSLGDDYGKNAPALPSVTTPHLAISGLGEAFAATQPLARPSTTRALPLPCGSQ